MSKNSSGRIDNFYRKLKVSLGNEWNCKELGAVEKYPIFLVMGKNKKETGKNLLIAGGFHGDEVAGVWGIIKFLTDKSKISKNINLTFLPLVNPTGFALGKRFNKWGENPNRGFCHKEIELNRKLSREGEILLKNIDLIKTYAADGFLSLHEDVLSEKLYVYTFEKLKTPGGFSKMLLGTGKKYFETYGNDIIKDNFSKFSDDTIVKNGLSFNKHDGSFEDYMFDLGVEKTACTDIPGKKPIKKRIETNTAIMKSFINYFARK